MHKGIGAVFAVLLMTAGAACGSGVSLHVAAPVTAKGHAKKHSCPSGTLSVNENGKIHCLATQSTGASVAPSETTSSALSSSSRVETAYYQSNARWPVSTNQAAQSYMATVVRYMNNGGHRLFPNDRSLAFPLRWSVGLMNNGGPSGSPIVLWQLTMPISYSRWTAAQWQQAFTILRNQYLYSGFAESHVGVLANSQGNAIDQAFQLVASNHATIRLVVGNIVPSNTVGITTPVPTTMLMWQPNVGNSFTTIWSKWIAPVSEYPGLISQSEANAVAIQRDFNSSGQQIWRILHDNVSSIAPSSESVPSVLPSSSPSKVLNPSTGGSAGPTTSSPSHQTGPSPSPRPPLLTVSGNETPEGIQVQWSASPQTNLPHCAVALRPFDSLTARYAQTIQNGGLLTPSVGTGGLLVVNCGHDIQGTSVLTYNYGVRATGLEGYTDGLPLAPKAVIYVNYNHSGLGYGQTPDQNLADYQVTTTAGTVWTVSRAQVIQGMLVLTVVLPPNTPTGQPVSIVVSTSTSVATDSAGAPSLTVNVHGSLNTGNYAQ